MGMGEARPRFCFELVTGEVLRRELEGVTEVRGEVGGALAGDSVDEVEGDVVKSGITKMVVSAPDGVRLGNALQHLEQVQGEALDAQRNPVDPGPAQEAGKLLRDRLGIRLDGHLLCARQFVQ